MQRRMWRDVLKRGDVIVSVNGMNVKEMEDLYGILRGLHGGQTVNMVVISFNPSRRTYRPISVDVILN